MLQACDTIRTDILRSEHRTNNVNICQQTFSDLGEVVKRSSDRAFRENFVQMCDAMNDYAGLDSRNLEQMVFEEVNPFEDTSKPVIYQKTQAPFDRSILPVSRRQQEPIKRWPEHIKGRFKSLEDL